MTEFVPEMTGLAEYLYSKFEEGLNLEIRKKMYVFGSQNYKEIVQLALRTKKLANERRAKGKFQKRKGCRDNFPRKVEVLNLRAIHPVQAQNLLVHLRLFDLHNLDGLAHHHLVLLSEDELQSKDAHIVVSLTLGLVAPLKCAFNVDRYAMS